MIKIFENRCALKGYVIEKISIFNTTYKGINMSEYICELYMTNWSYFYKVGIVFAMYQGMRSEGDILGWTTSMSSGSKPFFLVFVQKSSCSHPWTFPRTYKGQCTFLTPLLTSIKTIPTCAYDMHIIEKLRTQGRQTNNFPQWTISFSTNIWLK